MPRPAAHPDRRKRLTRLAAWLAWAALIIVLDQLTKSWVVHSLRLGERIRVLPFFDLTLLFNRGAAFSFLANGEGLQRWFFLGLALVAALFIVRWLYTQSSHPRLCAALSCILGGALGNAWDRLVHGQVLDFLLFYWRDWYFPAFNVADTAITCGAALLILDEILRARRSTTP